MILSVMWYVRLERLWEELSSLYDPLLDWTRYHIYSRGTSYCVSTHRTIHQSKKGTVHQSPKLSTRQRSLFRLTINNLQQNATRDAFPPHNLQFPFRNTTWKKWWEWKRVETNMGYIVQHAAFRIKRLECGNPAGFMLRPNATTRVLGVCLVDRQQQWTCPAGDDWLIYSCCVFFEQSMSIKSKADDHEPFVNYVFWINAKPQKQAMVGCK